MKKNCMKLLNKKNNFNKDFIKKKKFVIHPTEKKHGCRYQEDKVWIKRFEYFVLIPDFFFLSYFFLSFFFCLIFIANFSSKILKNHRLQKLSFVLHFLQNISAQEYNSTAAGPHLDEIPEKMLTFSRHSKFYWYVCWLSFFRKI